MMKLQTRYPQTVAEAVMAIAPDALRLCHSQKTRYWGGSRRGDRPTWTVHPELPADVAAGWNLLCGLYTASRPLNQLAPSFARKQGATLQTRLATVGYAARLAVALGLPPWTAECVADHSPFLNALAAQPDDVSAWLVYADWLDEQGHADFQSRAGLIRRWAAPAGAVRTKQGVPSETKDAWKRFEFGPALHAVLTMPAPLSKYRKKKKVTP